MTSTISRPTVAVPTTIDSASGGNQSTDSRPTSVEPTPVLLASGGDQLADRQCPDDTHRVVAVSNQPTDRQNRSDAHLAVAVGDDAGQGQVARGRTTPKLLALLDPALALAADVLDDIERVRIANQNRLRILTTSGVDSDGETRGFGFDETYPDVARLAAMVDMLAKVEHDATLNLARHMRKHPLGSWVKAQRGVGEKQAARLLAAIGDPYINSTSGLPRTVSALWAYCGLHVLPVGGQTTRDAHGVAAAGRDQTSADLSQFDSQRSHVGGVGGDPGHSSHEPQKDLAGVAPRRARGAKANWSTRAKTKARLIAESCVKQLDKPCTGAEHVEGCHCSPYRLVYDRRRMHTAITRPDWTDLHSHNDGLRVTAKEILKDLWRAARDFHNPGGDLGQGGIGTQHHAAEVTSRNHP